MKKFNKIFVVLALTMAISVPAMSVCAFADTTSSITENMTTSVDVTSQDTTSIPTVNQDSTIINPRADVYTYRYSLKPGNTKTVSYGSYEIIGDDTFQTNTQSSNPSKSYSYTTTYSGSLVGSITKSMIEANIGYSIGISETVSNGMNTGTGLAGYRVKTYARPIYTTTKVTQITSQYLTCIPEQIYQ